MTFQNESILPYVFRLKQPNNYIERETITFDSVKSTMRRTFRNNIRSGLLGTMMPSGPGYIDLSQETSTLSCYRRAVEFLHPVCIVSILGIHGVIIILFRKMGNVEAYLHFALRRHLI